MQIHVLKKIEFKFSSLIQKNKGILKNNKSKWYLIGNVVGQPIKPLIQTFARCSTGTLNVPEKNVSHQSQYLAPSLIIIAYKIHTNDSHASIDTGVHTHPCTNKCVLMSVCVREREKDAKIRLQKKSKRNL